MVRIGMPENVKYIIDRLYKAGFEAFSVGGCVRDSLIGRVPGDWDITTSALPSDIKKIFRHTVDTGIEHGTVTVLIYPDTLEKEGWKGTDAENRADAAAGKKCVSLPENGKAWTYEVTTYRIDGDYLDGRHPKQVTFTENLREDLRRRDFTINAMAYNDTVGLVDLFEGVKDLNRRMIRCVGNADERFDEDALRILRAVRFAAQLDFDIEKNTADAVVRHAAHLGAVSKERIFAELNKLLCSAHIERLKEVFELGLSGYIAGGFEKVRPIGPGTAYPLGEGTERLKGLPAVPSERKSERYALICRGWKEQETKDLLRALKSDLDTIRHASFAAARILEPLPSDRYEFKKKMAETDPAHFLSLLELKKSIAGSKEYQNRCPDEEIDRLIRMYYEIMDRHEPVYMKDLVVTGDDLRKAGMPAGPALGKILEKMLDEARMDPARNSVLYLFSKYLGYGMR